MNIGLVWLVFEINFKTNKQMNIEFIDTRLESYTFMMIMKIRGQLIHSVSG